MPYVRKTNVPNVRLSDGALRLFEGLSPEEKETVFRHFMEHWDVVRQKDIEDAEIPELPKLERRMSNCLTAMCQAADDGAAEYWKMVERNKRNRPKLSEENDTLSTGQPLDNQSTTIGQPLDNDTTTTGSPIKHPINQENSQSVNPLPQTPVPSLDEVSAYCENRGYSSEVAREFYEVFSGQGWKTSDGMPIRNWRVLFDSWVKKNPVKNQSNGLINNEDYLQWFYG